MNKRMQRELQRHKSNTPERITMITAILILADVFDFDQEKLDKFVDCFPMFQKSVEAGTDDYLAIENEIYERFGYRFI